MTRPLRKRTKARNLAHHQRQLTEPPPDLNDLIPPAQTAAILHSTVGSLGVMRCKGRGPAYVKVGSKCFYRRRDLEKYLNERRRDPSAKAASAA